jgi:hypothetical protein
MRKDRDVMPSPHQLVTVHDTCRMQASPKLTLARSMVRGLMAACWTFTLRQRVLGYDEYGHSSSTRAAPKWGRYSGRGDEATTRRAVSPRLVRHGIRAAQVIDDCDPVHADLGEDERRLAGSA